MQKIDIEVTKKGINILLEFPFNWKFVEVCRKKGVNWDADRNKRYLKFNFATLPFSADRLIKDYREIFDFYEKTVVDSFKIVLDKTINSYTKPPNILTQTIDLSEFELFEHQKIGIQFLFNKKGLCILGDEQGLGKTREVCVWLIKNQFKKVLIVSPLSAKFVWRNELVTLGIEEKYINIVEKNLNNIYCIINYDRLKKFESEIIKLKFDTIILDEAHYLKNQTSARFKIVNKIAKKCKSVIPVTATPVSNRPADFFPLLKLIKHPLGQSFIDYANRYCDRKLITMGPNSYWEAKGSTNLDELSLKLKDVMIRRLKKDCLDLPSKIYTIYQIELSAADRAAYKKLEDSYKKQLLQHNPNEVNWHFAHLNELRQFCSIKKYKYIEDYVKDAIANNEKIIIFSYYNNTLEKIYKKYSKNSVILTGATKTKDREEAVEKFQNNKNINIFLGNLKAAGISITLTASNKVVFSDLWWNPVDHSQSEDRANRIGSTEDLNVIYPIFKDTIEISIHELLQKKQLMINQILNSTEEHFKETSIINELINNFYSKCT